MDKNFVILLLITLLIFSLINNYIMYKKYYNSYSTNGVIEKLPQNIGFTNYIIFGKHTKKNIREQLNKIIYNFESKHKGNLIVYSSFDKQLDLSNGVLYDIKENLI